MRHLACFVRPTLQKPKIFRAKQKILTVAGMEPANIFS